MSKQSVSRRLTKKHFAPLALGVLFSSLMTPLAAHAQDKVIRVQAPQDAWQLRSEQTYAIIKVLNDPGATQAEHAKALHELDARLTASEKGDLTPIETMQLFRIFYVPQELQKTSPDISMLLGAIATQATLGWYDALRFADESGRAEIVNNEAFFALPLDPNVQIFVQFMKDHPVQTAAAVKAGIQYARDKIKNGDIHYDTHWPTSLGMLRMQCALQHAKTCEKPKPQPAGEWPTLFYQAAQRVGDYYRVDKSD